MSNPLLSPEKLLKARVPIGFAIHMIANALIRVYPLALQVPLVFLVWWELAKEFPRMRHRVQYSTTLLSLIDFVIIHYYPLASMIQISFVRSIIISIICLSLGISQIDTIVLSYLLFAITCVIALFQCYPAEVMLTITMAIAGSDCIQYFFGKAFGKTKIVPKISPNKSLEGYIAAIVFCNIINIWLADWKVTTSKFVYVNGLLISGILGDLFISWWKRNHSIKDTSALLTGHGGFLDRLDSHVAAWIWSYLFAVATSFYGHNFIEMDYSRIEILIAIAWIFVWGRFFQVAFTKGELI